MLVVGSVLADNALHERLASTLRTEDLTDQALAIIWREADRTIRNGRPATWQTIAQALEAMDDGADWKAYCRDLQAHAMPEYAEQQANVVRSLSDLRRIASTCSQGTSEALSDPSRAPAEIAASIAGDLHRIGQGLADWEDAGAVGARAIKDLETATTIYPTGLDSLDSAMMGGLYPGKFYGIAARHKAGKSMMLSTIAYNILFAEHPCGIVYVTLEMSPQEHWRRVAARRMGVNEARLALAARRNDLLLLERAHETNMEFVDRGLNYLGKPGCTLDELRTIIARAGMNPGVQMVFVDYLQLLSGQQRGQSKAEFLDEAAQMLASLASKYGLCIIAAAQLNQEGNVRGSEGLLNACDMALFLHKVEQAEWASAWIEMRASRYTPAKDVGSEDFPPFFMDYKVGPHFREDKAA